MTQLYAYGIGTGTQNAQGKWLEAWFPQPCLQPDAKLSSLLSQWLALSGQPLSADQVAKLADQLGDHSYHAERQLLENLSQGEGTLVLSILPENVGPTDVPAAYLKLQLLSHRLVRPHQTDLTGIFACLPNVAWTSEGAVDPTELEQRIMNARAQGRTLVVHSLDKFPRLTDYVAPSGVRIADASRVRLGAYLGEGTTVMHEGFINYNAGCEGPNMVEGRISAGVFVGAGSDLGGGSSTMGTLSGGGNIVISVGRECLLGANAGLGIPLGDRCTVEAGLYITAGTKVRLLDDSGQEVGIVKAGSLAGESGLLFRRNSLTGAVECLANRSAIELNHALHAHN